MKITYNLTAKLFLISFLFLLLHSCDRESFTVSPRSVDSANFVDQNHALSISQDFNTRLRKASIQRRKLLSNGNADHGHNTGKIMESITSVSGTNGMSAFYIVNYKEGGFTIISGDKRTMSIMAFSETGSFPTDTVPAGVNQWLFSAKAAVDSVRNNNVAYTGQDTISRNLMVINTSPPDETLPDPDNCPGYRDEVGPLLQTQWNQAGGGSIYHYNDLCPELACGPNGHAYTGCTTTSVAQIAKYHQFPSSYNYSLMDNTNATSETARLMGNIFKLTIGNDYDCNGSSGDMDKTVSALHSLGYSSAHKIDYYQTANYETVMSELDANRPVILSGGHEGSFLVFPVYKGGHEWVCDGYVHTQNCMAGMLYFHMNWGWGGLYNGNYGLGGFNPGGMDFNYKGQAIIGIHP